jgi:hypothetical protein
MVWYTHLYESHRVICQMLRSTCSPNLVLAPFSPSTGIWAPPDRLHRLLRVFFTSTVKTAFELSDNLVKLLSLYLNYMRAVALMIYLVGSASICRAYFCEWLW